MTREKPIGPFAGGRILTTSEIRQLTRLSRSMLGETFLAAAAQLGWSMEDWFRMSSLAYRVRSERDRRGLSTKDVAAHLRVPQYRLLPIEEGRVRNFEPEIFWRYIDLLDQREWMSEWISANRTIARRLGLVTRPRKGRSSESAATKYSNSALHPAARARGSRKRRSVASGAGRG
jgi:hypothetical protein